MSARARSFLTHRLREDGRASNSEGFDLGTPQEAETATPSPPAEGFPEEAILETEAPPAALVLRPDRGFLGRLSKRLSSEAKVWGVLQRPSARVLSPASLLSVRACVRAPPQLLAYDATSDSLGEETNSAAQALLLAAPLVDATSSDCPAFASLSVEGTNTTKKVRRGDSSLGALV